MGVTPRASSSGGGGGGASSSYCSADGCRLLSLLAVWYGSSVLTSLSTKEILRSFPHPVTLALVQQAVAAACGWASLDGSSSSSSSNHRSSRRELLTDWQMHAATLQMSGVMVVALVSYRWSLMGASVAFVHTVKTLGPVFTIIFARALLGERLPLVRYLAVMPIVLGVALTSITEAECTLVGLVAAGISTSASALQAVAAKRLLRERQVGSKAELFAMAALQAFFLLLPLALALDAWRLPALFATLERPAWLRIAKWLFLNGLCSFVNQYVALSVLDAMSSPLSYALAQVMKRATVITVAMAYAARPVTPLHVCGVALSLVGALGYQQVGLLFPPEPSAEEPARYELVSLMSPASKATAALEAENSTDSTSSSEAGTEAGSPVLSAEVGSLLDIVVQRADASHIATRPAASL